MVEKLDKLREEAARLGAREEALQGQVGAAETEEAVLAVELERRRAALAAGTQMPVEVADAERSLEESRRLLRHARAALEQVKGERQRADHRVSQAEREIERREANLAAAPLRKEAAELLEKTVAALAHPGSLLMEREALRLRWPAHADPLELLTLDELAAAVCRELHLDGTRHWAVRLWIQRLLMGPTDLIWHFHHAHRHGLAG